MTEMITIPKKEYERLKSLEDDFDYVEATKRNLKAFSEGQVTEVLK